MQPPDGSGSLSPSASLCSSLGYVQDFDNLLHQQASPLMPLPEVSYSTLIVCMIAFKVLSKMKEGERLDVTAENVISKYSKPQWLISRWWQSFMRWWKDQHTADDLTMLNSLTDNALKSLAALSQREVVVAPGEKIFFMHKFKKYVKRTLDITLSKYLETCTTGASNSVPVPKLKLENHKKEGDLLKEKIGTLLGAINTKIEELERMSVEQHKTNCEHLISWFSGEPVAQVMLSGLQDNVLSSAVRQTLKELFKEGYLNALYKQYRISNPGMIRVQDYQALFIGLISQGGHDTHVSVAPGQLTATRQKIPLTGVTTPLQRYQRIFARDLGLLKAHQSHAEYFRPNQFIGDLFFSHYANIERDLLDLAPPFTLYPECPLADNTVYECVEGRSNNSRHNHSYFICPLRSGQRTYALALIPKEQNSSPTLKLIITDPGNPAIDSEECRVALIDCIQKTHDKSLDRKIAVEFCVTATTGSSTVLQHFVQKLSAITNVNFSHIGVNFWGPAILSEATSNALNEAVKKLLVTQFHLRYFLFHYQTFTTPAIPQIASFRGQNVEFLNNFYISLFYFKRDRDSPDSDKKTRRYFSLHDEGKRDNETYLCKVLTNNHVDTRFPIRENGHASQGTNLTNTRDLIATLTPPPPPPGWGDLVYNVISNSYVSLSSSIKWN